MKIPAALFVLASVAVVVIYLKEHGWSFWIIPTIFLQVLAIILLIGIDLGA